MGYILAGLLLWLVSHGLKRFFPAERAAMGSGGRGVVSLGSLIAIGLMAYGYRTADPIVLWNAPEWFFPINNVLMLVSVYLFAVGGARTRLSRVMRHPMLNGLMVWSVAHILVNGDVASLLMFGGLGLWARMVRYQIDRADVWQPANPAPIGKEIGVTLVVVVVYVAIIHLHDLLGSYPFWWGWPVGSTLAPILSPLF